MSAAKELKRAWLDNGSPMKGFVNAYKLWVRNFETMLYVKRCCLAGGSGFVADK